ncbi:MAG: hypothetical protein PHF17_06570 [Arcobacteraceae bacterium]|nr:hypothetical protein [Arcobacteraceae bacterium]
MLSKIQPDEIYNLGAQSHVAVPEYTVRLLDAINLKPKFYQVSFLEGFQILLLKVKLHLMVQLNFMLIG